MSSGNAASAAKEEENMALIDELKEEVHTLREELDGAENKWEKDNAIYVQTKEFLQVQLD
jgi:hypothetical protein